MTLHRATQLTPRSRRALRRARLAFVSAALALAAASCDDVQIAASLGSSGGSVGIGRQTASAVVGRWLRIDPSTTGGYTTETTWEFQAGGTATRTVVTRTALGQVVAVSETRAGWSAGAGVLLIDLGAPSFRILRVPYSISYGVEGTILYLDGVPYLRVDL